MPRPSKSLPPWPLWILGATLLGLLGLAFFYVISPGEYVGGSETPGAPETLLAAPLAAPDSGEEAALWGKLQSPVGQTYAVLLRHALAPGTGDPANFQLDDCVTQRNLSEVGQRQAVEMGENFRRRNIQVSQVLSSQWCRCLETAELMNIGPVIPFPALNSFFQDRRTAEAQTAAVTDYLVTHAEQPGVVVMVTHQVNITGLSGVVPTSGSAVVVQLGEDNQLSVLGQLAAPGEG